MPRFALRGPRGFLALGAVVAAAAVAVAAQQVPPIQPTPIDQATVQIVATLLERFHLAKPKINDELSRSWLTNYIKALDPRKNYLLKADVDEFHKYDTDLDDTVATGDLGFAKLAMERFQQRVVERHADAMEILQEKPDFTIDEVLGDADKMDYPTDAAEAKDRMRKLIKFELLRKKISKVDDAKAVEDVTIEFKDLHRIYSQYEATEMLEKYLTALTMAVDPHSSYMGAKEFEDQFKQRIGLTLDGIGAVLAPVNGYPTIQEVVPGGAADKDGRLQAEDKIIAVIHDDGTRESFIEKKLSDVVRKIRGPRGTKVTLVVIPADSKEEKTYELTRQKIDLTSDKAKGQILEVPGPEGTKPKKIGVIDVPSFYGRTSAVEENESVSVTEDCRALLEGFKSQGVDAVVVDVRMNPGGLLDEAVSLSGLFLDKGPVVQIREAQRVEHRDDEELGAAWDGPLTVVIDHYCASASEIFAGAIKDYGRGLVVGDSSSFGKGSVQNVMPLNEKLRLRNNAQIPDLGALKLTIQQFYLPDGDSTQIRGVTPHLHIPSINDFSNYGESRYDTAMKFDKVAPLPHDKYNRIPSDLLDQIRDKSEARRQASDKFQEEKKFIAKAEARKEKNEIPLNEEKFRAEMRSDDEAEEAKPKPKGKKGQRKPEVVWESNYYNDEVMAIVADYLNLGSRVLVAEPVRAVNPRAIPPLRP